MKEPGEKNKYELSFMVRSESGADEVKEILRKRGAEATEEGKVAKVRLAYPIKKETFAFFGCLLFESVPGIVDDLKNDLQLSDSILRFLIVKPAPAAKGRTALPPKPKAASPEPALPKRAEVLSNEALEQTLEEILQ